MTAPAMRRWKIALAAILLVVAVVAAAAVLLVPRLLDLDARRPQILAAAQQALGRRVSYDSAALSLRPAPALEFRGITVAEKTGDTAFVTVERLRIKFSILPLLHKEIHLREVIVERPVVTLDRNRAGVFSIDDLFRGKPSTFKINLGALRVHNATVRFTDRLVEPAGLATSLEGLELSLSSLLRGETSRFKLTGNLSDGNRTAALDFSGRVDIPTAGRPLDDSLLDVALTARNLDAGHYWPYYGRYTPLERLHGLLDIDQTLKGKMSEFTASGRLWARDVHFSYSRAFPAPLTPRNLRLAYDVERTPRDLTVKTIDLDVDGLRVSGSCALTDLHTPDPHLRARAAIAPFRLRDYSRYIPYGIIPRGTGDFIREHITDGTFRMEEGRLEGRISRISHMGQGDNSDALAVRARVEGGVVTFGTQVPTFTAVAGALEFRGKDFLLNGMSGRFGASPFTLEGKIAGYPLAAPVHYPFSMAVTPGKAEVAWLTRQPEGLDFNGPSLLRLSGSGPASDYRIDGTWELSRTDYRYHKMLHKPVGMPNTLSFTARLDRSAARLTELRYDLPRLRVNATAAYLFGDPVPLSFTAATDRFPLAAVIPIVPDLQNYRPTGSLQAKVSGSGSPAGDGIRLSGDVTLAEVSLQPSGQIKPLNGINGIIHLTENSLEATQLTGRVGSSPFEISGRVAGGGKTDVRLAFSLPLLGLEDVGFTSSGQMPEFSNISGSVSLRERSLTIDSLSGQTGGTTFMLNGTLPDIGMPQMNLTAEFPNLKVEDLLPLASLRRLETATKKSRRPAGKPSLKARVTATEGSFRDIPFQQLHSEFVLKNDRLDVPSLRAGLFAGSLFVSGRADFSPAAPPAYRANYRLERVAADQLLRAAGTQPYLKGLLSATGDLTARGTSGAELAKSLQTSAGLQLHGGEINLPASGGEPGTPIPCTALDAKLAWKGDILTVQELKAGVFGGSLSGSGTADFSTSGSPSYRAGYQLERVAADQLLRAAGAKQYLSGELTAEGELTARGASGPELGRSAQARASLHLQDGAVGVAPSGKSVGEAIPYRVLDAKVALSENLLTIQELKGEIFGGSLSGSGRADFTVSGTPGFQASYRLDKVAADHLLRAAGAKSYLSGLLTVDGNLSFRGTSGTDITKSGQISAEIVLADGVMNTPAISGLKATTAFPFKNVRTRLSLSAGKLDLDSIQVDVFGGVVSGKFGADFAAPDGPAYIVGGRLADVEAASLFRAFDVTKELSGRMNLQAELSARGKDVEALRKTATGTLSTRLEKGVIKKYGFVTKVFSILNVSQLVDFRVPDLTSFGTPYDEIHGNFAFDNGRITTDDLSIHSPSLNMTVVGNADLVSRELDVKIGVQPFQTFGRIIARIPIAGWILTGGKKAVLVVYYEAKGPFGDPTVTGTSMSNLPGGVYNIFKRAFDLPGELISEPGKVIMGN